MAVKLPTGPVAQMKGPLLDMRRGTLKVPAELKRTSCLNASEKPWYMYVENHLPSNVNFM